MQIGFNKISLKHDTHFLSATDSKNKFSLAFTQQSTQRTSKLLEHMIFLDLATKRAYLKYAVQLHICTSWLIYILYIRYTILRNCGNNLMFMYYDVKFQLYISLKYLLTHDMGVKSVLILLNTHVVGSTL